jgi:hypothetical protein
VTLTVTDSDGKVGTSTVSIVVTQGDIDAQLNGIGVEIDATPLVV